MKWEERLCWFRYDQNRTKCRSRNLAGDRGVEKRFEPRSVWGTDNDQIGVKLIGISDDDLLDLAATYLDIGFDT